MKNDRGHGETLVRCTERIAVTMPTALISSFSRGQYATAYTPQFLSRVSFFNHAI